MDASGLETVGLGAAGIVAVLGTAEGGVPVTALEEPGDVARYSQPDKMQAAFRSGQLREVANMLFAPASDPDILGGAVEVVVLKTNPATQSEAQLKAGGVPQIDLTSRDYGAFTSQINVELQPGTSKGKMLTVRFEDVVETVDDLGGDAVFTLQYAGGSYGYNTALAAVNAAGDISVTATRFQAAVAATDAPANPSAAAAVEIVGANQTGSAATLAVASGIVTLTGLTGMTATHVGRNITISGAGNAANNGTFVITQFVSATSVKYVNTAAIAEGPSTFTWTVSDAGLKVTLYGISGGLPVKEVLTHAGTTVVASTTVWAANGVLAVVVDKTPVAGTLTVRNLSAGTTIFTVPVGQIVRGGMLCEHAYVEHTSVTLQLSAAGTPQVLLFGKDRAGATLAESITMTGTTPVTSVATTYSQIELVVIANVADTVVTTLTALAAKTLGSVQNLLRKVESYFATKMTLVNSVEQGFIFNYGTGKTSFPVSELDIVSNVNVKTPATGSFTADLYAIIAWVNQNSQLVSAAASSGAVAVPDDTAAPVFLAGGVEGTALFTHYQQALNFLKRLRVNSVVDLSGDPAVAAALNAHCAYMGGYGRSERDGFVGLLNGAMDDVPTKAEAKAQIIDLNSRHIRAAAQAIERFDSAGERVEFLPPFLGAIYAGAQAGAPVGTSLTFKFMNVLSFRQHSSWNPTDDAEEMIEAGLCFLQQVEGVGRRVTRNITTHLSSDNIAFTEGSVNAAVNFAVFNFRTAMEYAVGKRGFAGTLAAARSVAVGTLSDLVDATVLTSFRALSLSLEVDVLEVSVEIAPIIPINFVKTTVHLVTVAQTA